MKKISVEQLPLEIQPLFEGLQQNRILVMRNGEPFAVIAAVGNKDEEDLDLEESPEFWQMIQERRREKTVPLEEIKARIAAEEHCHKQSKGGTHLNQSVAEPEHRQDIVTK